MERVSALFETAAGSVVGREHLRQLAWRNNQDGFAIRKSEHAIVAIVTDGCGSEIRSESGAAIGAELFAEALIAEITSPGVWNLPHLIVRAGEYALHHIGYVASAMRKDFRGAVFDHFLFTVNGAVITPARTATFAIGDGVCFVNGRQIPLGPFPDNAPPYAAYALTEKFSYLVERLQITAALPTSEVESILIGTDGVEDLIAAEHLPIPGRTEMVGSPAQFWSEDRYFQNPDAVRRRLALINQEHAIIDWKKQTIERTAGRLIDDTTLIAIRRKP